jgi:hypothetical protein
MRARPTARRARLLLVAAAAAGVLVLAGCGGGSSVDSGGFTAAERQAAQAALDGLQDSNISLQLLAMTQWTQNLPAACRIRQVSKEPVAYEAYVFWIPWLAEAPYVWLNMKLTGDPKTSTFDLGTAEPILPGGRLNQDGRTIRPGSADTTLLERYGAQQERKSQALLREHAGTTLQKPGADCQVLKNGALRLLPAAKA